MTIDTVFHDLSNETKAARISDNHGASSIYAATSEQLSTNYGYQLSNISILQGGSIEDIQ